jgi:hypothetical protein
VPSLSRHNPVRRAELLRLATRRRPREQDRPTLSRTGSEARIVSGPLEEPFPANFTLGGPHQTPVRSAGRNSSRGVSFAEMLDVLSGNSGGAEDL